MTAEAHKAAPEALAEAEQASEWAVRIGLYVGGACRDRDGMRAMLALVARLMEEVAVEVFAERIGGPEGEA